MSFNNVLPARALKLFLLENRLHKAGIEVTDDMRPLDEYPKLEELLKEAEKREDKDEIST